MKKTILAILLSVLMITTVFALDYSIELVDSYGDGWNGGTVTVNVNGTAVLTAITLATGTGPEAHTFSVEGEDIITTVYTAGSWGYENEYQIFNELGVVVAQSGQGGATPVNVTYTVPAVIAGTPDVPTLVSPANLATNVPLDTNLEWTTGANTDHSVLYIAEDAAFTTPTVVENPATSPYTTSLNNGTTYYWKVVAVNTSDNLETPSQIRSFTTAFPSVTEFPYEEGFEDAWVGSPAAPAGWGQITVSGSNVWNRNTSSPHTGTACAQAPWASAGGEHLLVTPTFDLDASTSYRLKFWLKGSSYYDVTSLTVQIASDYVDETSFTDDLAYYTGGSSSNMPTVWTEQIIDLTGYSGNQAIAFRLIDANGMHFYIDDVKIEEIPTSAVINITPDTYDFGTTYVGYEYIQTFTVSNDGVVAAEISEIELPSGFSYETEIDLSSNYTLEPNASFDIEVTFVPQVEMVHSGNLTVKETDPGNPFIPILHNVPITATTIPVPQGATCSNPIALNFPAESITGNTGDYIDDYETTWIAPTSVYLGGHDVVYQFTLAQSALLNGTIVTTNSGIGAFIVTDEPNVTTPAEVILSKTAFSTTLTYTNNMLNAGTYFLIISSSVTYNQTVDYTINLTADALPAPAAATIPYPANDSVDRPTDLTLSWNNANYTETIDLWFGVDGSREMELVLNNVPAVDEYEVTDLTLGATYNWKVVNRNYTGQTPEVDVVTWSFTTIGNAPEVTTYSSPANLAVNQALAGNLTWQATTGASGYYVYFSEDETFAGLTPVNHSTTTYSFTGLDYSTTYYWKVIPYNSAGQPTEGINVWSFTTLDSPFPEADLVFDGVRSVNHGMPMEPYYGYTMTQNIYHQEEIDIADSAINSISYLYNNNSAWSETIEVYVKHTTKDVFDSVTDWELDGFTHVYSGTMTVDTSNPIVTIDFATPFVYNNTDNLMVMFFATQQGYTLNADEFYNYPVTGNRSLTVRNDATNYHTTFPTTIPIGTLKAFRPVSGFNFLELTAEPQFTVSADTLNFNEVEMGLSTQPKALTISNLGLAELGITGAVIAGTNADQFQLTDVNVYPVTLGTADLITLEVTYVPTIEGEHIAELQITDNQGRTVNTVQLIGTSVDNNIYASDLPWNESFEGDLAGWRYMMTSSSTSSGVYLTDNSADVQSGTKAIQLYNAGSSATDIRFISPTFFDGLTGTRLTYWVKGSLGTSLIVGTYNQQIDVFTPKDTLAVPTTYTQAELSFPPTRTGERIAFVTVYSGSSQNIYLDNLSLVEIADNSVADLSTDALEFDLTLIDDETSAQVVSIRNLGLAPLTITNVALTGLDNADFSFNYDIENITLAYDESLEISVVFAPLTAGEKVASLEITDDISRSVNTVALSGTAVDPTIYEVNIPYFLDFETAEQLLGWEANVVSTSPSASAERFNSSFSAYDGSYSFRIYHPSSATTDVELISPLVVPDMDQYRVRFMAKTTSLTNTDPLVIGKYDAEMNTFTEINSLVLTTTYLEYTIDMVEPTRANERIVFKFETAQAASKYIYVDNLRFEAIPLLPLAELNVTALDFGDVDVELAESATETVTITNVGPGTLNITNVAITGTDATMFSWEYVEETPDMALENNESLAIDVTFAPTTPGDKGATLVITDDLGRIVRVNSASKASNNSRNANEVALTGFGWVPPQGSTCADPLPLTFPAVGVTGNTADYGDDYENAWVATSTLYLGGDDVVYQFTLANSMLLNGTITTTGSYIGAFILQDEPNVTTPVAVTLVKSSSGQTLTYTNEMIPAGTYYLIISSWPAPQSIDYTINLTANPLPAPAAATNPSPANLAIDRPTALNLGWTNAANTETIDLYFGPVGAREMALVLDNVAVVNSHALTDLTPNTEYAWKVINRNYSGETADSLVATWTFTTIGAAPEAVTYTAPADESTNRPLSGNLSWQAATGAAGYYVYLSEDETFTGVTPVDQAGTSYAYSGLDYLTTYYWKVIPYNVVGQPTEGILVWSFTTIPDPTIPMPITIDFEGSTTVPAAYITAHNMFITGSGHGNTSNVLYKNIFTPTTSAYVQFQSMNNITATSVFEFDYRFIDYYSPYPGIELEDDFDYLIAKVSTDNGATFDTIDQINSTNHTDSSEFARYSIDISAYAGQSVIFRLDMPDDDVNDYWFDIDNIYFGEPAVTDPDVPVNFAIAMDGASITLTWDSAANANSYNVYGCDTPDGEFVFIEAVDGLTTTLTATEQMKFYSVKASTDMVGPAKRFGRK